MTESIITRDILRKNGPAVRRTVACLQFLAAGAALAQRSEVVGVAQAAAVVEGLAGGGGEVKVVAALGIQTGARVTRQRADRVPTSHWRRGGGGGESVMSLKTTGRRG